MIRIDEIYNHTFWPWIEKHLPGQRMFYCDPFGHTGPENLYNHGSDFGKESDYIFFHDQEPIQLEIYKKLFADVVRRNADIKPQAQGHIVVSERGDNVFKLCDIYGWKSSYYFFHGWACLDWYRGYHRTFLFPGPSYRPCPTVAFMSPNRIIGGERQHRALFVYHCIKQNLAHNHWTAPRTCPEENQDIVDIVKPFASRYHDISEVLQDADLPRLFSGEQTQQMTSCWLGNFDEAMDSLIYVPTETVYWGRRTHLTEKTMKAIALGMPFVLVATAGSLEYLREYGFRTFSDVWDESYDQEQDDFVRLEKVVRLLKDIDNLSIKEKTQIWRAVQTNVIWNWNHFYHGGFESVLWSELENMLHGLTI
jgi:hypothetical protein